MSVCAILTGTEGPGAGVDWVTVVMALPWVVVTMAVAAVVEAASVLLVPSAPSSVCWAAGERKTFKVLHSSNEFHILCGATAALKYF